MKRNIPLFISAEHSRPRASLRMALNALLAGSLMVLAGTAFASPTQASHAVQPATTQVVAPQSQVDRELMYQQAVADDLAGRNGAARKAYDTLAGTEMAAQAAVPSAINLAALGQFDASRKAFDMLTASTNARDSDYAHLWQLWLTARTWAGKPAALKKELARMASGMNVSSPSQQALIRLYAGTGSTDAVFAAIATMPGTDELQRRDALTEATFFAGGYQQFVARDNKAALDLYEREQNQLNSTSLERPLINKAAVTLQAAKH